MDIRKLQRLVVDALEDVKGADIRVFNSTGLTQLFDRVIIASGTSNRQTKALAASVRDKVKAAGGEVVSVEGEETGEWVLVDLGDAIVHVMQPAIRSYYNLEEIWGAKPVSMRSLDEVDATAVRSAVSRRANAPDPERVLVAKKTTARKKPAAATSAADDADDAAAPAAKKTAARSAPRKTAAKKVSSKAATRPATRPATKTARKTAKKTASRAPAAD